MSDCLLPFPNGPHPDPGARAALGDDPWALTRAQRLRAFVEHAAAQEHWLPRLQALVEPPAPDAAFPAFLLDAPRYADLRAAVAGATSTKELDVGVADQLQRFVDLYRDYLAEPVGV
ncbi:MAG: hypothetical protein AAF628_11330 [Planctomycetota bacterium]